MGKNFSIQDIASNFPEVVVDADGEQKIDYEKLSVALAEEVLDLRDQLLEKDFQVVKIFERLERLSTMV